MFNLLGGWCDFSQLIAKESKRNLVSFSERGKKAALCSSSAAGVTGPRIIQRRGWREGSSLEGSLPLSSQPDTLSVTWKHDWTCALDGRSWNLPGEVWSLLYFCSLWGVKTLASMIQNWCHNIFIFFFGDCTVHERFFWFSFVEEHGQLDTALLGDVSLCSGTVRWG